MIGYWHDTVICLRLSVTLGIVALTVDVGPRGSSVGKLPIHFFRNLFKYFFHLVVGLECSPARPWLITLDPSKPGQATTIIGLHLVELVCGQLRR